MAQIPVKWLAPILVNHVIPLFKIIPFNFASERKTPINADAKKVSCKNNCPKPFTALPLVHPDSILYNYSFIAKRGFALVQAVSKSGPKILSIIYLSFNQKTIPKELTGITTKIYIDYRTFHDFKISLISTTSPGLNIIISMTFTHYSLQIYFCKWP